MIVHRDLHGEWYGNISAFRDDARVEPVHIENFGVNVSDLFG